MKKIFAIALALVMVLSMASAFASQCTAGFDWTSTSANACGKAKIEVVPYVKVSNGCGGFKWQVSECAGSVAGENIYWAVKLTVDANLDTEWWAEAAMTYTTTGMTTDVTKGALKNTGVAASDKEAVYYYDWSAAGEWKKVGTDAGQISVADDVEDTTVIDKFIKKSEVKDSSKAKVCVNLNSVGNANFSEGVVGEYYVSYGTFGTEGKALKVYDKKGGDVLAVYTVNANDVVAKVDYTGAKSCAPDDVASIKAFFGIDEGTKLSQKLVNANFGWEDKLEDCFKWNATTAIVDNECVVAIPKTGDASVLAWLF